MLKHWRYALLMVLLIVAYALPAMAEAPTTLTMDQAVATALQNNCLIREAEENARAAVEAKKSARADFLPKASLDYGYLALDDPPYLVVDSPVVTVVPGLGGVITGTEAEKMQVAHQQQIHWSARLTQPLFTGFALTSRYRMADLGIRIKSVEHELAAHDVIRNVKGAFLNVLLSEKMLAVREDAEKSLTAHAANGRRYYEEGLIPNNDLLESEVALAAAVQRRVEAQARADMAVAALNTLLNWDVNRKVVVQEVTAVPAASPPLTDLLTEARDARPELRALRLESERIGEGVRLAASAYYPKVSLVGEYYQDGRNLAATENDYSNSHNAAVAVQAKWTFFESGKTRAETARLKHQRKAWEDKTRAVEQDIRLEVKQAYTNLEVARTNIVTAEKALSQARENLRINQMRFAQHIGDTTDVLDATVFLTRSEANYYQALYGCQRAEADLERAVGRWPQGTAPTGMFQDAAEPARFPPPGSGEPAGSGDETD